MGVLSLLSRCVETLNELPTIPKLLLLCSVSYVAYSKYESGKAAKAAVEIKSSKVVEHYKKEQMEKKKKVVVLGTGWGGMSFSRRIDCSLYDVVVISPRNYFAFTPLLPSVTCGTVEARSIVEPVRKLLRKGRGQIQFWEAECEGIDDKLKRISCRHKHGRKDTESEGDVFSVEYDYLVIAVGCEPHTVPGVKEYCHLFKNVEDAQKIRRNLVDCFERASLPQMSDEERQAALHFVVVGGGPAGVSIAAELHDFIFEDLINIYPKTSGLVKITLVDSKQHVLKGLDVRISSFAEDKFRRESIEMRLGYRVMSVSDKAITITNATSEISITYGMVIWSTGHVAGPFISQFMKNINQNAKWHHLAIDAWLRVKGCENVYALGDCTTIHYPEIEEYINAVFLCEKKPSMTFGDFKNIFKAMYPQVWVILEKHTPRVVDLLGLSKTNDEKQSKEFAAKDFISALSEVYSHAKGLPATAQVACQQGAYLASHFNQMIKEKKEAQLDLSKDSSRIQPQPFRYKHFTRFVELGGHEAAAELPGDRVSMGHSTQWLWYSVYASKQVSWRTRLLVISDWTRRFIFGRDSSRI